MTDASSRRPALRSAGWLPLVAAALMGFFAGCTNVPTQELGAYRAQFDAARTQTEDYLLATRTAAEELADDPTSTLTITQRAEQLDKRRAALDERLRALRVIAQYNDALTRLAANEDPAAIKASLDNFSAALQTFDITKLSAAVGDVVPYGQVIAGAIEVVDRLIRQQRFRQAVEAGEKPVLAILEVLVKDADDIYTINEQRILLNADPKKEAIQNLGDRFVALANQHAFAVPLDAQFQVLLTRHNELRAGFKGKTRQLPALAHTPPSSGTSPTIDAALALEALTAINDQTASLLDEYNGLIDRTEAERKLKDEYKNLLNSTRLALVQVRVGIDQNRQTAILNFITDAYRLRQAYLAAREAANP